MDISSPSIIETVAPEKKHGKYKGRNAIYISFGIMKQKIEMLKCHSQIKSYTELHRELKLLTSDKCM